MFLGIFALFGVGIIQNFRFVTCIGFCGFCGEFGEICGVLWFLGVFFGFGRLTVFVQIWVVL